jgi:subtilase family serine protease
LDAYDPSDITTYERQYHLPSVTLQNVLVDGGPGLPSDGQDEVTLDIELQIAMAPGVSKILVYEAPNGIGILDAWTQIASDDAAPVVSTSWGIAESLASQAFMNLEAVPFTGTAAPTIFAAMIRILRSMIRGRSLPSSAWAARAWR